MADTNADSVMPFDLLDLSAKQMEELLNADAFLRTDIVQEQQEDSRDAKLSPDDVDTFIEGQKKINTKASTKRDIQNVQRWLWENKRESRAIENIIPTQLNVYLSELFISIRKKDGSNYEPGSLESMKNSIDRHLKDNGCQISVARDAGFHKARQALTSKKMELKKLGKGRFAKAASGLLEEDEEKMFSENQLGMNSPVSLQFSVFYWFGKMFGLRGRDEQRNMAFGDIELKRTANDQEFLELHERNSKTMDGSKREDFRQTTPKIFATGGTPERDPVEIYKEFVRRRPATMNNPDSPFYLTPIPESRLKPESVQWYYPVPMGKNKLGTLMKNAATNAGLSSRLTNHSVRKTCVRALKKAKISDSKTMQITGHKNTASVAKYDGELDLPEHREISSILAPKDPNVNITPAASSTQSAAQSTHHVHVGIDQTRLMYTQDRFAQVFQGANIQNCTFNFH